jgi:hypothetical protein
MEIEALVLHGRTANSLLSHGARSRILWTPRGVHTTYVAHRMGRLAVKQCTVPYIDFLIWPFLYAQNRLLVLGKTALSTCGWRAIL